jgi:predicted TIM-barrel fold metal-dependent hydrolase
MIEDAYVFDGVAHPFNFSEENIYGPAGQMFSQHLFAFNQALTPEESTPWTAEQWNRDWPVDEIASIIDESDVDLCVSMPLPLTDMFEDGLSSWEKCAELAERYPEKFVFWGTVNPLEGRKALDLMEVQVKEYGAKAFKFYNTRYDFGEQVGWRMDDPTVAFPMFEKMQELGVNLAGVHKGLPLGPQRIEHLQTWDMDGAAEHFPEINFVIFHVGMPFLDETLYQLIRWPNLYASIAATINLVDRSPMQLAEILGKLLFWAGEDKIVWGSETPVFTPQWALEKFWDFELPEEIVQGYGVPALTKEAKRKILGENLLRLHGREQPAAS